jgi:ATP-binding cassette, subfamily C, bacterial CydD
MAPTATLWRAAPRARTLLALAVALGLLASGLWYAVLVGLATVIARVFIDGATLDVVSLTIMLMAGLIAVRAILVGASEVISQSAASEVKSSLRGALSGRLLANASAAIAGKRAGELVHLVTEDVERLDEYVARYLPARYSAVFAPALVLFAVAVIDPLTLPILLFAGPLLVLVLALIGRTTQVRTRRRERELAWMDGHFLDMLRGLPTLRLFGRAQEQVETIDRIAHRLAGSSLDVLRTAFQTSLVLEWGATAATALVAIAVSVRLMAGEVAFERALAVLLLTPEFFVPIRGLAARYHGGMAGKEALTGIEAVLGVADRRTVGPVVPSDPVQPTLPPAPVPTTLDLAINAVSVRFGDRDRPALDALSFDLDAGQYTVLAGATGSGKSTVVALLLRFLEPEEGVITVGGIDLRSIDPVAWRRHIAWVPQHPHLFDGTVADNLRLGRPGATDAEVAAAATAAGAAAFIGTLPAGYATRIGEGGARLSGGERQRLAIARAFVRDAPLLIFDEPTSHLDDEAAAVVRATLRGQRGRRTVLVISHDPAVSTDADRVVVLEGGRRREGPARPATKALPERPATPEPRPLAVAP